MKTNLGNEIFYTFWAQRDIRERRMLLLAGFVVVLAIIYLAFIDPAVSGSIKLQKDIPQLRQKAAEIQLLAQQFEQFSGTLSETVAPISKDAIDTSLARKGLKPLTLSVVDDMVRLELKQVDYSDVMDWILESQHVNRLTVEEAKLSSLEAPGQVDILLTLKQQRR